MKISREYCIKTSIHIKYLLKAILIIVTFLIFTNETYSSRVCDSLKACLGNALTQTLTSGKSAHYVDVLPSGSLFSYNNKLTVEFWWKPQKQQNKTQFIAGIWGPAEDANDVWVIYINPNDELCFEVNHPTSKFKSLDNTIARIDIASYYNKWSHISCVFDGAINTVFIYIDGSLVSSNTNSQYPINYLKVPERSDLSLQVGGSNAISNDPDNYRTFLGQMDEFRIWHKTMSANEIYCGKDLSLVGNEKDLILYFRFNQNPQIFNLCDASTFGNNGIARSGAACRASDRRFNQTIIITPSITQIIDTLKCENKKIWNFKVRDTSSCNKTIFIRVDGIGKEYFKVNPVRINNPVKDTDYDFTVTFEGNLIGNTAPFLQIYTGNNCRDWINIPIKLTRASELSFSKDSLGFDMIKALCIQTPYIDSVIRVCNTTNTSSNPKSIIINSITSSLPQIFSVITPTGSFNLAPGECRDIIIRLNPKDTTALYKSQLIIKSNDACNPEVKIDLEGKVQEVLGIYKTDGKTRLTNAEFGTVCVDFASDAVQYIWADLLEKEDIIIDTIIYPKGFTGVKFRYPVTLKPKTGYLPDFFRFFPDRKGLFNDSIIFVVNSGGCQIRKPVYVKGTGFESELSYTLSSIDFGSIPVGQTKTLNVEVKNTSNDQLRISFYLKDGSGFFLNGAKSVTIPPNSTRTVPLTFNPAESKIYFDEICFFEGRCFKSGCIQVKGEGYSEKFVFEPEILKLNNVIGCQTLIGKIKFRNNTGQTQVLNQFVFADTSGKFRILNPKSLPTSITLDKNEFYEFEIEYSPNQANIDRNDRAYIYFKDAEGIEWNLKITGSSQTPKIFVTQETTFGQIEVGEKRIRQIMIENISPYPVRIDSIITGMDFNVIYPTGFTSRILNSRDTIQLSVEFAPTQEKYYNDKIIVFSSEPCRINFSGDLSGRGYIIPLDIPISVMSFGFIKPCECAERKIQLINESRVFDMLIDSIYINGDSIVSPRPELFSWNSDIITKTAGKLPYKIKPLSRDTVTIKYCPAGVFNRDSIDHSARIWVRAIGNGWNRLYNVYLSGKMEIPFESDKKLLQFNPTRVDTFSTPNFAKFKIPPVEINQNQDEVVINSISFMPDERVFSASINGSAKYPVVLKKSDSINIKVDFKPRSVREYSAKMVVHYSKPCNSIDTTILVIGSGYAPAFGLSFNFENKRVFEDTLKFISCDTLYIPAFSSRKFPANVVDIKLRFGYDTTKLYYVGEESTYLSDTCKPHLPSIRHSYSIYGGSEFTLKNFCSVDSLRPLIIAKFLSKSPLRDEFPITLDSISFDTEEVILYNLVAANDNGKVISLQPEISIKSDIDYDSVQVLDCKAGYITVVNIGDVPVTVDDLVNLPPDFVLKSLTPPKGTYINIGDSCIIEVDFCPRKKGDFSTSVMALSNKPCFIIDTCLLNGIGYAPEFLFKVDISSNFDFPDTLNYTIGDTLNLTFQLEKDLSAIRNGIKYNIMDLDFDVHFKYNPAGLKLISTASRIPYSMITDYKPGNIKISYKGVDALRSGSIADMKFLALVPDSIQSFFDIYADNFKSDSLMFLDIKSFPVYGICNSDGKCSLTYIKYTDNNHNLGQNFPNPWSDFTDINFSIMEKVPVFLDIYDVNGQKILNLIDGNQILEPGNYSVRFYSDKLNSGIYYYTIRAGIFANTKKMMIVK